MTGRTPRNLKLSEDAGFTSEVKSVLTRLASTLRRRGYRIHSLLEHMPAEIGDDASIPLIMRRRLDKDFDLEARVDSTTPMGGWLIKSLSTVSVSLSSSHYLNNGWSIVWSGAAKAADFIRTAEGRFRVRAKRLRHFRCPMCPTLEPDEDNGLGSFSLLERKKPGADWLCRRCKFAWRGAHFPIDLAESGKVRFQFKRKCPKCDQPLVWIMATRELHCTRAPKCKYRLDGAEALALGLMEGTEDEEM